MVGVNEKQQLVIGHLERMQVLKSSEEEEVGSKRVEH